MDMFCLKNYLNQMNLSGNKSEKKGDIPEFLARAFGKAMGNSLDEKAYTK